MKIIDLPSPNFSERNRKIDTIILHYTGMQTLEDALNRMTDLRAEVSAHYCIARDGRIFQLVQDEKKAWHAGKSFWKGLEGLNDNSIGIEIENKGHEWGYENFTEIQMDSVIELCKNLIKKHDIKSQNIVGHSDVAPDRKEDPGEFFNWKLLSENGVGIYHNLKFENAEYEGIRDILDGEIEILAKIGYKNFEDKADLKKTIIAFYRHFFPERILLSQNRRYPENIYWDSKASKILDIVKAKC
jgi:N-acetylmuramoyl-L-alanine amidase